MKRAIIDIGSNSVRLLLWADGKTLYKRLNTTRLAEGMTGGHILSVCAMQRTAKAVAGFAEAARAEGAKPYAFATAAVRLSRNGADFCGMVKSLCGLEVDVVSGEDEATLAAFGALGEGDGAVVDVGGASTEFIVRKHGETVYSESFSVGAVVLKDACGESREKLKAFIAEKTVNLKPLDGEKLYAVGGTATTLAAVSLGLTEYDSAKIQGCFLPLREMERLTDRLFSLSMEERSAVRGMDKHRADIIAGGAFLLTEVVKKAGFGGITVSDRDNLEGYLYTRVLR